MRLLLFLMKKYRNKLEDNVKTRLLDGQVFASLAQRVLKLMPLILHPD
jgi:hypothetical protein